MKTAKEILHEKAAKYKDGFLSGQMKWLIEAMNEYASQPQSKEAIELETFALDVRKRVMRYNDDVLAFKNWLKEYLLHTLKIKQ